MSLFVYLLIPLILLGIFLVPNWKYKWVSKYDFYGFGLADVLMVFLAYIFWPLTVTILVVWLAVSLIIKYLIPS